MSCLEPSGLGARCVHSARFPRMKCSKPVSFIARRPSAHTHKRSDILCVCVCVCVCVRPSAMSSKTRAVHVRVEGVRGSFRQTSTRSCWKAELSHSTSNDADDGLTSSCFQFLRSCVQFLRSVPTPQSRAVHSLCPTTSHDASRDHRQAPRCQASPHEAQEGHADQEGPDPAHPRRFQ
jgi:hypothetical protein